MKLNWLVLFWVILTAVSGGWSFEPGGSLTTETLEAKIIHTPVASLKENEKFVVDARVDGVPGSIVYVRLYFRSKGNESFDFIEMTPSSSGYSAELSPGYFSPPELDYFILALLPDQTVLTYPSWNPYGEPLVVPIVSGGTPIVEAALPAATISPPVSETILPDEPGLGEAEAVGLGEDTPLLILSPENGEELGAGEEVVIAVSFLPGESEIAINSISLFVDAVNVTLDAEITEHLLTYSTSELPPGKHRILVQGHYASGVELPRASWSFAIVGERREGRTEPLAQGRVFAETRQEKISNVKFSDNNVGGFLSGKYGVARYNARVYLTTRESSRFQPRHRYSFNLDLPVVGVTLGDTYPRFNDLMLWGKRIRGIHGRLHLGFFNVDVIHGETVRKVAPLFAPNIAGQDSLTSFGTHRQKVLGIRQSWGGGRHFQLGFNLLKVRDDTTSLAAGEFSTAPKDNIVVGSDLFISVHDRRIELRASGAFSLLSNDISTGPATKADVEQQFDVSLPFDPADFSKYFIINSSTTPLDPRDLTSLAYNINLRLDYFNNNFQFGYKSIGSQYVSLGNSFLRNNLRGFYFNDRLRLYKNRIYLDFGFENYLDNFDADNQNPSTRLRTITSGFSIFPGPGMPNLTFSLRNHNRDNDIDSLFVDLSGTFPDTTDTRENNNTKDLTVQLNYDVNFYQLQNAITLSYIASNRDDLFGTTRPGGVPNLTETSSNVELISVRTQYQIPLVTTINFARNDNKFAGGTNAFNFKLFGAKAEYALFNKKLRTYFGTNYTSASGNSALTDTTRSLTDYNRLDLNLGARYEITPGHFVLIDGHLIRFNDNGGLFNTNTNSFTVSNPSFSDRIFRLYYEKRF